MASETGGNACRRQRRMGPAPFASFEDLSDETESSPSDGPTQRLPGINEDTSITTNNNSLTPNAPRIDISRASSSSQHEDSRDSTPERELFQTPGQGCARLGLAFKEEGALELRSSTEELDFQDPNEQRRSPVASVTVMTVSSEVQFGLHQRKDSQGSEFGGLLSISGRTSRLSSIGSQGSRVSEASRLSVTSGISRSPSPHKMLLETSFCGSKTGSSQTVGGVPVSETTKLVEAELLEKVLLSRKHDPTEAVLAEGISIECRRKIQPADSLVQLSPVLQHVTQQSVESPSDQLPPTPIHTDVSLHTVNTCTPVAPVPPEKPVRKSLPPKKSTDVIITVDKPVEDNEDEETDIRVTSPLPGKLIADSGIEYIFIPLKGPLPKEMDSKSNKPIKKTLSSNVKINNASAKVTNFNKTNNFPIKTNIKPSSTEPQYIRIKLKPDYMYPDEPSENYTKPETLDLNSGNIAPTINKCPIPNSTPSPSISRKSSFTSLFRGKDYGTSPESPTVPITKRKSSRSRSKSSDRARTSENTSDKSKHRSVFTLFKSKKTYSKSKQSLTTETSPCRQTTTSLHSLEFTFDQQPSQPVKKYYEIPLEGDSIIIPLHSPGSDPPPPLPKYVDDDADIILQSQPVDSSIVTEVVNYRQSSTSSENVVFSTNLGSDNEVFTTKLPKRNNELENTIEKCTDYQPTKHKQENNVYKLNENVESIQFLQTEAILQIDIKKTIEDIKKLNVETEEEVDTSERAVDISDKAPDINSSESENEILLKASAKHNVEHDEDELINDHERKGLVLQQDSFEDELPYVPTTLPLERSVAVPIVPIKQRATFEIRTCPIERPRSTTPINPSCLEDYCEDVLVTSRVAEKLKISLPREDSILGSSSIVTSSVQGKGKPARRWTEFVPGQQQEAAPPLPPRGAPKDWINFEEIPERRKPPKRIQTIPSRGNLHPPQTTSTDETNVIYNYVNPEDCKCECHETGTRPNPVTPPSSGVAVEHHEDELPLLATIDRRSDSSPESQNETPPPTKKSTSRTVKSTNAFPNIATTSS